MAGLHGGLLGVMLIGCTVNRPAPALPGYPVLNGAAQANRYAAFQDALSHNPSGRPRFWSSPGPARGRITPLQTVPSELYGWCRSYEEQVADARYRQAVVGVACRTPQAGWMVLDLRRMPLTSSR